jgi:hypothetical protein
MLLGSQIENGVSSGAKRYANRTYVSLSCQRHLSLIEMASYFQHPLPCTRVYRVSRRVCGLHIVLCCDVMCCDSPICQSTLQCATGGYEIVSSTATGAAITSGGGFSVYSARPAYQATVRPPAAHLRVCCLSVFFSLLEVGVSGL